MNLKPLSDHIIVKALSAEETSSAGIIIPDTVDKERPERGEVLAVGPGRLTDQGQRLTIDIKEGDKVIFKKYSPDEIKIDGKEYLVIRADDVMAIID